jgi:hypothetical protein
MSLKPFLLPALAALAVSSQVSAKDFAIPQTVNVPAYDFQGRSIDIIGFVPGMKADVALKLLQDRKPGKEVRGSTSSIGNRTVSSESFDSYYYSWQREKEEINVYLTSPSAGNEVFSASRNLEFWNAEERPDFEKSIAALVEKYGDPSKREDILPDPRYINKKSKTVTLMWYLGGAGKCELKQFDSIVGQLSDICNKATHKTGPSVNDFAYTPAKADIYSKTATAGSDILLVAHIHNNDGSDRVFRMTVSFTDLKRRALSAKADIALIEAEQAKFDSVKVAAPEL